MRWKKTLKSWNIGDYIRQLSVIVIGIIITFMGSDAISNYTKKKELRTVMSLIKEELKYNRENLQLSKKKYNNDQHISLLILQHSGRYEEIPTDTLVKYSTLLSNISSFEYTEDAMEVLKNSSLMQQVSDKKLLLHLIQTYAAMKRVKNDVAAYYEMKHDIISPLFLSLEEKSRNLSFSSLSLWEYCLSDTRMKNFVRTIPDFFDTNLFQLTEQLLDESILSIEAKYE